MKHFESLGVPIAALTLATAGAACAELPPDELKTNNVAEKRIGDFNYRLLGQISSKVLNGATTTEVPAPMDAAEHWVRVNSTTTSEDGNEKCAISFTTRQNEDKTLGGFTDNGKRQQAAISDFTVANNHGFKVEFSSPQFRAGQEARQSLTFGGETYVVNPAKGEKQLTQTKLTEAGVAADNAISKCEDGVGAPSTRYS